MLLNKFIKNLLLIGLFGSILLINAKNGCGEEKPEKEEKLSLASAPAPVADSSALAPAQVAASPSAPVAASPTSASPPSSTSAGKYVASEVSPNKPIEAAAAASPASKTTHQAKEASANPTTYINFLGNQKSNAPKSTSAPVAPPPKPIESPPSQNNGYESKASAAAPSMSPETSPKPPTNPSTTHSATPKSTTSKSVSVKALPSQNNALTSTSAPSNPKVSKTSPKSSSGTSPKSSSGTSPKSSSGTSPKTTTSSTTTAHSVAPPKAASVASSPKSVVAESNIKYEKNAAAVVVAALNDVSASTQTTPKPPKPAKIQNEAPHNSPKQDEYPKQAKNQQIDTSKPNVNALYGQFTIKPVVPTTYSTIPDSKVSPYCPSDILFVLDSTGSITHVYEDQRAYIIDLVQHLNIDPKNQHAGLILYSSRARQEIVVGLDQDNITQSIFLSKVQNLPFYGGVTATGSALNLTLKALESRRTNKKTLVVVLTDGFSFDNTQPPSEALQKLSNVQVIVTGKPLHIVRAVLDEIAGNPNRVLLGDQNKANVIKILKC